MKENHRCRCPHELHALCDAELYLSVQADIKDILWFLRFKQRGWVCQLHSSRATVTDTHVSTSLLCNIAYHHILPSRNPPSSWEASFVARRHRTLRPLVRRHIRPPRRQRRGPGRAPPHVINRGRRRCKCGRTDQILETLRCAGAAELWRKDSRRECLGWGPFKSNCVAHGPRPSTGLRYQSR